MEYKNGIRRVGVGVPDDPKEQAGITLIALIITLIIRYDKAKEYSYINKFSLNNINLNFNSI